MRGAKKEDDPVFKDGKENYKRIQEFLDELFKNPREISFEDASNELKMYPDDYFYAIRTSLKSGRVFLKRGSLNIGVNAYNRDILKLWEANIDIQFVLDEFAVAAYMVNYINKVDSGLSKLLPDAGNVSLRQRFQKISNVYINGTILSAQEAAYLNLSMSLSKFSREVIFINTSPIDSRVRMLKSKQDLEQINKQDTNITVSDVFEKYSNREGLDNVCLADFVAIKYESKKRKLDGSISYGERDKPKILRWVSYSIDKDPVNFFRVQCLLFYPWRNEKEDIENKNNADTYYKQQNLTKANQRRYSKSESKKFSRK